MIACGQRIHAFICAMPATSASEMTTLISSKRLRRPVNQSLSCATGTGIGLPAASVTGSSSPRGSITIAASRMRPAAPMVRVEMVSAQARVSNGFRSAANRRLA